MNALQRSMLAAVAMAGACACGMAQAAAGAAAPVTATTAISAPATTTPCGKDPATSDCTATSGGPINFVTGTKLRTEVDLSALPGVLGLELVRYYNSALGGPGDPPGLIGRGWRLSYETSLSVAGPVLTVHQPNGDRIDFTQRPSNPLEYLNADALHGKIIRRPTPAGDEYTWYQAGSGRLGGLRFSFNPQGRLVQIAAPSGEFATLLYDGSGHLLQVTDPQGRSLKLHYLARQDSEGRFAGIQSIDTPVGTFTYAYGGASPAGFTGDPRTLLANLVRVTYPGQDGNEGTAGRVYHYDDPRFATYLTGISAAWRDDAASRRTMPAGACERRDHGWCKQRIGTFAYDAQGRANLSVAGWPARLETDAQGRPLHPARLVPGTGLEQVVLDFSVPGQTTLINALGQRSVYHHTSVQGDINGQPRVLWATGAGCNVCPASNVRYEYDAAGHFTARLDLDAQGLPLQGERFELDGWGRVRSIEREIYAHGKLADSEEIEHRRYAGLDAQGVPRIAPDLLARPSVVPGREHTVQISYNDAGQPTVVVETGYQPGFANQPLLQLQRSTTYTYQRVNGRSVLAAIDGPLPNGATNSPADSDVTTVRYDAHGNFIRMIDYPYHLQRLIERDPRSGRITAQTDLDGITTRVQTLPRGQPLRWQRGLAAVDVELDALQRPILIRMPDGEVRHLGYIQGFEPIAQTSGAGWARWEAASPMVQQALSLQQYVEQATVQTMVHPPDPSSTKPVRPDAAGALEPPPPEAWPGLRWVRDDFGRYVGSYTRDTGWDVRHYDGDNRVVERVLSDGAVWRWQRDALGRILRHTVERPGSTTLVSTLDYVGARLQAIHHPNESESFEYDQWGRVSAHTVTRPLRAVSEVQTGQGTVSSQPATWSYTERFGYDAADRVIEDHLPEGGELKYRWGTGSQLQAITYVSARAVPLLARWFGWGEQTIIRPLERTALAHGRANAEAEQGYAWGNGIRLQWGIDDSGRLSHIDYLPSAPQKGWRDELFAWLPALAEAHASEGSAPAATVKHAAPPSAQQVRMASEPLLRIDYRYDLWGRMMQRKTSRGTQAPEGERFAYDTAGRLLVVDRIKAAAPDARANAQASSASATDAAATSAEEQPPEYYAYARDGQTLAERIDSQDIDWRRTPVTRDASGLPGQIGAGAGARMLSYSADHRLARVRLLDQSGQAHELARYVHNTHGLRIAKTLADGATTQFLWSGRQLVGETVPMRIAPGGSPESGLPKIARRYVYAQGTPVAVIDYPLGAALDEQQATGWLARTWRWTQAAAQWITGHAGSITYVHANEIGAPIAASDEAGRIIWRASYTAYGLRRPVDGAQAGGIVEVADRAAQAPGQGALFDLNLRFPGQYFDAETGWSDNGLRTYDPRRGQYLEPDPLGAMPNRASARRLTQAFGYANEDPLIYADPLGLILFAFDGTGNGESAGPGESISNVRKFFLAYDEDLDGKKFYITGIGTTNTDMTYGGNVVTGDGFNQRVELGIKFLNNYIATSSATDKIDIDVVGFSRGAAEARVWVNDVISLMKDGKYTAGGKTRCLNFRFEGLWDTVLHLGLLSGDDKSKDIAIPDVVGLAVQAVAMNEYRAGAENFDGQSIMDFPSSKNSSSRIEIGFVGSHSDIGGGYSTGDLSDVALMWMIKQAVSQGVEFRMAVIARNGWDTVVDPIVHDKSWNRDFPKYVYDAPDASKFNDDRELHYQGVLPIENAVKQSAAVVGGVDRAFTQSMVTYYATDCGPLGAPAVGVVDMAKYAAWLNSKAMGVGINYIPPTKAMPCG